MSSDQPEAVVHDICPKADVVQHKGCDEWTNPAMVLVRRLSDAAGVSLTYQCPKCQAVVVVHFPPASDQPVLPAEIRAAIDWLRTNDAKHFPELSVVETMDRCAELLESTALRAEQAEKLRDDYMNAAFRNDRRALDAEAQLEQVARERDKWLDAFNKSEQFQNGPTKRAEATESELTALRSSLTQLADDTMELANREFERANSVTQMQIASHVLALAAREFLRKLPALLRSSREGAPQK